MKTLICTLITFLTLSIQANTVDAKEFKFCTESDLFILSRAYSDKAPQLNEVINQQLNSDEVTCAVAKETEVIENENFCSNLITETYHFQLNTKNHSQVSAQLFLSYTPCIRILPLPTILSFSKSGLSQSFNFFKSLKVF